MHALLLAVLLDLGLLVQVVAGCLLHPLLLLLLQPAQVVRIRWTPAAYDAPEVTQCARASLCVPVGDLQSSITAHRSVSC